MLSSERKPAKPLTRREREIAGLVAEGLTNREIARKLFISERTAEGHVEQIRNKLGFTSRSQVASWATQNLLASPSQGANESSLRAEMVSEAKPKPEEVAPWRVSLPQWPFGIAGALGVATLVLALFAVGISLEFRLSPQPAGPAIYTYAGTGVGGYWGDDGPAAKAELRRPTAIAIDQNSGAVYIVDGNRVRRILGGSITTVVGSGSSGVLPGDNTASTSANLNLTNQFGPLPHALAIDSEGNVYLADPTAHSVWRATKGTNGTISRFAGTGTDGVGGDGQLATKSELARPSGLVFDSHDNLFIADAGANSVREVSDGVISTLSLGEMKLSDPHGLALDHQENLYIADTSNHRVVRVTPGHDVSVFAPDLEQPIALAIDRNDNVYVADGNRIWRVDVSGRKTIYAGDGNAPFNGDGRPPTRASLNRPLGVAVDAVGNLFVVDTGNNRIREIPKW